MGNWQTRITAFGHYLQLSAKWAKAKTVTQYGITNRCNDGKYILFLDYDNTPDEWVIEEQRLLQRHFTGYLGNAYLFKTRNGYHVMYLEKNSLDDIINFLALTTCDKQYKDMPLRYGRKAWVLRMSPKNDEEKSLYIRKINGGFCRRERSNAHRLALEKFHGVPTEDFFGAGPFDDEEKLEMAYYKVADENA